MIASCKWSFTAILSGLRGQRVDAVLARQLSGSAGLVATFDANYDWHFFANGVSEAHEQNTPGNEHFTREASIGPYHVRILRNGRKRNAKCGAGSDSHPEDG